VLVCPVPPDEILAGLAGVGTDGGGEENATLAMQLVPPGGGEATEVLASLQLYRLGRGNARTEAGEGRRFRFGITNMVKNIGDCGRGLALCAVEWLEWHRMLGIDQFYIYNNGSDDDTLEILRPYVDIGVVTLVDWPVYLGGPDNNRAQRGQINHAIVAFGHEVESLSLIDWDEFILPRAFLGGGGPSSNLQPTKPEPPTGANVKVLSLRTYKAQHPDTCAAPASGGGAEEKRPGLRLRDCRLELDASQRKGWFKGKHNPNVHSKLVLSYGAGEPRPLASPHWHTSTKRFAEDAILLHFARSAGCLPRGTVRCPKGVGESPECISKVLHGNRYCGSSGGVGLAGDGRGDLSALLQALELRLKMIFECAGGEARETGLPAECVGRADLPSVADQWELRK